MVNLKKITAGSEFIDIPPVPLYQEKMLIDTDSILTFLVELGYLPDDLARVPDVTFNFSGNADWKVGLEDLFVGVDEGVFCVTIVPNIGQGNFNGNFNMIVEYDLEKDVLSFASGNCSNK
ncbi:hypothetical protein AMTR_s00057p00164650 [Amborella trichopoda]|uniref:Xylanase inhibitor C-terminal domain-containing protein n=1 Tax=Amborella trichopoda TaxID=13333 RepID=U5D639_AMBTC|nr:hypothetical protein AMTR_s00057p00164650 [Amborella trichopoda]